MDKQTHLNLRQVPEDLLPALKTHLAEMDSIKKANTAQARCVYSLAAVPLLDSLLTFYLLSSLSIPPPPLSPVIKAASEKLSALKDRSPSKESPGKTIEARQIISGLPSASEDILEAQRKRFEELKVRTCIYMFIRIVHGFV